MRVNGAVFANRSKHISERNVGDTCHGDTLVVNLDVFRPLIRH